MLSFYLFIALTANSFIQIRYNYTNIWTVNNLLQSTIDSVIWLEH